ncbi:hypothetical protein C0993_004262 [Termitomyces sp. T159_Od127]|nr:hypothetical protein C0993_004262 [Termitomyces sp. T159_Od127]
MIPAWGNDNTYLCLSPLCFLEASKNLLEALRLLARTLDMHNAEAGTPFTNHALEYEKHLNFFKQIEDFADSYAIWYKFEHEVHLDILMANVLFNWQQYTSRGDIILQSYHTIMDNRKMSGLADHGGSVYWANTLWLITVYTNTEHWEERKV